MFMPRMPSCIPRIIRCWEREREREGERERKRERRERERERRRKSERRVLIRAALRLKLISSLPRTCASSTIKTSARARIKFIPGVITGSRADDTMLRRARSRIRPAIEGGGRRLSTPPGKQASRGTPARD